MRWLILLFILATPLVVPSTASAHALLQESTPADGATYDRAPGEARLVFTEDIKSGTASIQIFDSAGKEVPVGSPTVEGGGADTSVLTVPLGPLPKDRYFLRWRAISSDDLHDTSGSIVFGIGIKVDPADAITVSGWDLAGSVAESVLRWLALVFIGVALAALVLSRRLTGRGAAGRALSPVLPRTTVAMAAWGAGASAALGLLYLGRVASVGGLFTLVSAWEFTLRWVVSVASAAAAWWLLRRALRRNGLESTTPWSAGLLVLSMVAITSTSHATALNAAYAVIEAIHTVATMLWVCGAAVVALVAVPALRRGERPRAVAIARAFTVIALITVPVSLVTGFVLAGRLLPSVGAVLNTDYGHALLLKLGLLAMGLACAGATVLFLVRGGGRHRAAAIVGAEAVVLSTVVLAASWLAATHPASYVTWAPSPEQTATSGVLSQIASDLVVTADVGPGRPGRNFVTVGVLDTRRPAPAPVVSVSLEVGSEPALSAVAQGSYQWLASTTIEDEGPVAMVVTVERKGQPTVRVPFVWTMAPAVGTRLGGAALAPLTTVAALLVGLAGLITLGAYARVRTRRRRSSINSAAVGEEQIPAPSTWG